MKSYSSLFKTCHRARTNSGARRSGFTLIEITVVLAIAAVVAAITVGGFTELRAGNKRTSCQTNLTQIYQAARLYATDNGAFPPYKLVGAAPGTPDGIGLAALYGFPNGANTGVDITRPVNRYLRNEKALHCPAHTTNTNFYNANGSINMGYLSYQVADPTSGAQTYEGDRGITTAADPKWRRQLLLQNVSSGNIIPPASDTVVTWCSWHRSGRDYDNVLFYDGTVQFLPRQEDTTTGAVCTTLGGTCVAGWERTPKPVPVG